MKKLLSIIVLSLLWCNASLADTNKLWKFEENYLTAKCFVYEWMSSDNFKELYKKYATEKTRYGSPEWTKWWSNVGLYYGKEIPLEESFEYYDEKLSLTRYLKDCVSSNPITHVMEDGFYEAYHITYDVPKKFCKDLAPNIKSKCLDLKVIFQYKRYRTPFTYHYLYGVFELENKEKIILILKDFHSDEEFDEFKATFKN